MRNSTNLETPVNQYREKVPEFYPRSLQWSALFEGKKVQKSYPTRFLDFKNFNIFFVDFNIFFPFFFSLL